MTLPPIRDWWPELSQDGRRAVLNSDTSHLDDAVREEIRVITGAVVGMVESLSDSDLAYARKHSEAED
ncbi:MULTISPECIES: hypothetical protein [Microbacterium]|jgi:hypothetical protein|uniref:Uncharacterized protein n=1 Tax=Microbacterium oxydans TaxID=82380 RepID=A0A3Q9J6S5_9MICO|nr:MULTISPECIES: hypothetical protein [Microbacterium]AZS41151.1 hypothetical protein CVS54_02498 [Microbacterium oxydans]KKX96322.1 hypothetical protein AAY78_17740 [Microbacterium sp. Ag1]NYF27658.1 hypothetical protein [Microbacterium sp. JAI119]RBO71323.1 hypothetical protein DSP71_17145 [Microbacterium sp. H6]